MAGTLWGELGRHPTDRHIQGSCTLASPRLALPASSTSSQLAYLSTSFTNWPLHFYTIQSLFSLRKSTRSLLTCQGFRLLCNRPVRTWQARDVGS
ncbi:uncharacterized protein LY79DRAFT_540013 [Colletotrichum navitas]|uniref:Uncharacterized protein n=1 Tax=Colletotrichum navitas TaxID=681940 RepID=A0AAD8VAJ6_9PEZI|nr:uncharacterized protein LY79DRAFT_540013 [Colletotrichum navitas]KAK1598041.1 hypothetical protein LY79DRAFT_540013 [Colletotrichum navitas]